MPSERGELLTTVKPTEVMVNVTAFEMAPPGFITVMLAEPDTSISLAGMDAVSRTLLKKVVLRFDPFHLTVVVETKLEPLRVNVKAGPPADTVPGSMLVSTGAAETTRVNALLAA